MIYLFYLFVTIVILLFVYFRWQYATLFHPRLYREDAFDEHFRFLRITTDDGIRLEGCIYEPDRYERTLLYFGGRGQDSVGLLPKLSTCYTDLRIVTFNYRGYGKSEGKADEKSMMGDALLVYEKVHKHFGDIEVMGYSLGCAPASFVAAGKELKKLYLIAPFSSLKTLVKDVYGVAFPLLRYSFDICKYLKNTRCEVKLFISKDDNFVPYKNAKRLKSCIKKYDEFVELEGLNHVELLCERRVYDSIIHPDRHPPKTHRN